MLKGIEKAAFWPVLNSKKKRAQRPSSETTERIFSRGGVVIFILGKPQIGSVGSTFQPIAAGWPTGGVIPGSPQAELTSVPGEGRPAPGSTSIWHSMTVRPWNRIVTNSSGRSPDLVQNEERDVRGVTSGA